jgi:hypothetical protein
MVSFGHQKHIARHNLIGQDIDILTSTANMSYLGKVLFQCLHRPFGAILLNECKHRVENSDSDKRPAKHRHALTRLHRLGREASRRREIEQDAEEVSESVYR